jgi:flagellar motor switch protein FliN
MSEFENVDVKGCITGSVTATFSSMLSQDVRLTEAEPPGGTASHRMVGTLTFAGNVTGIVNVQVTLDFGRQMAAAMLGREAESIQPAEEVRDVVAEITNIVGGNLKSVLNDAGHPCLLSTPAITYGSDFSIKSLSMDRFERFVFQAGEQTMIVEVGLKTVAGGDSGIDLSSPDAMNRLPEVDTGKLSALDYRAKIVGSVIEVFDTLLSMPIEPAETVSAEALQGTRNVSSVCFAGDATGIVSIHVGDALSRLMASSMPGGEPDSPEGDVAIVDLLGELGNIVGSGVKSALTDCGLRCALSTPAFTSGSDFMIESLNLERYERYAFSCQSHTVVVELGIKISDLVKAAAAGGKEIRYTVEEPPAGSPDPAQPAARPKPRPQPARPKTAAPQAAGEEASTSPEDIDLKLLLDIPVELTVELGRTRMPIQELLSLRPGSTVRLSKLEGEAVDILANDILIARGEVVIRNEKYGLRITQITSRVDRLKGLR